MSKNGKYVIPIDENSHYEEWYLFDTLMSKCQYKNGEYDGLSIYYYANGNIRLEVNYCAGKKHGYLRDYYENGNLRIIESWYKGRCHGLNESYDTNGRKIKSVSYLNGKIHRNFLIKSNL